MTATLSPAQRRLRELRDAIAFERRAPLQKAENCQECATGVRLVHYEDGCGYYLGDCATCLRMEAREIEDAIGCECQGLDCAACTPGYVESEDEYGDRVLLWDEDGRDRR